MKAIILNSGIGSRLGDLTKDTHKCLVDIGDETILGFQLKKLQQAGITDIIITTGHMQDKIKKYVGDNFPELKVQYVFNKDYLTTNYIYSIYLTKDLIDDDIITLHGDLIFEDEDLKKVLESESNCVLLNNTIPPPEKDFKGRIEDGIVKEVGVKVFGENCFFLLPLYKLSKESFMVWIEEMGRLIKNGESKVYAENALNNIPEKLNIKPIFFSSLLGMEIDDLEDLEKAKELLK